MNSKFIFYKNSGYRLEKFGLLRDNISKKDCDKDNLRGVYGELINEIISCASTYGFSGNIWHSYITYLLIMDENEFSIRYENEVKRVDSLDKIAIMDYELWKGIYDFDFAIIDRILDVNFAEIIYNIDDNDFIIKATDEDATIRINELSKSLSYADSANEFMNRIISYYQKYGVGKFGLAKAFRIMENREKFSLETINCVENIRFEDLIGYEIQKNKLINNTEAFIVGKKANNCLLFGDAGTGKSSSIKALLNEYFEQGIRVIEVYKHQYRLLNELVSYIRNRNYKFIIYMDDLSFEEFEIEYKYLKAVIEGGLESKSDNVLIYATSNRRHLIRENFGDRSEAGEDKHKSDTVAEKLSLAARFGVSIYYGKPERKEYYNIIIELARRNNIDMPEEELLLAANRWEIAHGGLSGRTAQQFIRTLA